MKSFRAHSAPKRVLRVQCIATETRKVVVKRSLVQIKGSEVTSVFGVQGNSLAGKQLGDGPVEATSPSKLLNKVKKFMLPDGYPHSITGDYLPYMIWTLPTHILGSVAHALTTSSLLQAVGIASGPVAAVGTSAAIKWITKDGIGALGRFVVGGSLSSEFDREPRRWRMVAEVCVSIGAGLEIATAAFPQHFLLLATAGQFTRAVSKSIGKPVFRVIQTHFALDRNVGSVAAKEEVWEVIAQLSGYAVSLAVLNAISSVVSAESGQAQYAASNLVAAWAMVQASHILLRYKSLSVLVFKELNEKRARMLCQEHITGQALSEIEALNQAENILLPPEWFMKPDVRMGKDSVSELIDIAVEAGVYTGSMNGNGSMSVYDHTAERLLEMYDREHHMLVWHEGCAHVILAEDAPTETSLRALWQATWLHNHCTQHGIGQHGLNGNGNAASGPHLLEQSVRALQAEFPAFLAQAEGLGWDMEHGVLMKTGEVRYMASS